LIEEFGVTPRVGWNIDPFGHTEANAALFHDLGFDAVFFARMDWDQSKQRFDPKNRGSHFIWRPFSNNFGKQKEIFAGVLMDGS
jgi:alpha-mannosidase